MTKRLEIIGLIATGIAVTGVVTNNAQVIWCFPLFLVSNNLSLYLHVRGRMGSLILRDAIFIALAVAGWIQWSAGQ